MADFTSLKHLKEDLLRGNTSCTKIVETCLQAIKQNLHLNVFLEIFESEALDKAAIIDQKINNGKQGELAGIVVGIKDMLCYKGHNINAGSKILNGFKSKYSATAVQRLIAEDAIIIGRQNCDEFGMGSSNENSAFGPVLNYLDEARVPGGSSGGSAVAVQTGMCHISIGSDTGGSVRQPAAFCGLIGLKPTYSRISRYGLIAYASSYDCIGIISKSIEENAAVLQVIAGEDDFDSTVSHKSVPNYNTMGKTTKNFKIAYYKEVSESSEINVDIKQNFESTVENLTKQGHVVDQLEFPMLESILPTYYLLTTAEASANLSRYDGVRYGYRFKNDADLDSMYKKTRSKGFGSEVKKRILLGTFVLEADYYDAYYLKAQKVRKLFRNNTKEILNKYDFIITPTTPTTAFKVGEMDRKSLDMYFADLLTVQASVTGLPAISVPNGFGKDQMPIGIQAMTDDFKEKELYSFGNYLINLN